MASGTSGCGGREIRGHVIWHVAPNGLRAVPRRLVATQTICRGQVVVVVDVTGHAGRRIGRRVRAHQREAGYRVIEAIVAPRDGVMASGAVRRGERRSRSGVRWIVGLLPCSQMATRIATVCRCDLQIVVVVGMALRARHIGMPIRQRKTRRAVVKSHRSP
jgi:hypothetical protein